MEETDKVFAALSSPIRREILWRVWREELPAGEIARSFDLSAPTISQHLAVLLDAGLIAKRVRGTYRLYRAVPWEIRGIDPAIFESGAKWVPNPPPPESKHAEATTGLVVQASVRADVTRRVAFRGFTDARVYSAWLGGAVTIEGAQFHAVLGNGTRVRGTYDQLVAPSFIGMNWDHETAAELPLPGRAQRAYLHISPAKGGCLVEVHQMVESAAQAAYMENAWRMVLGRFKVGIKRASAKRR
ncbi:MAG: metalloregulator ArsR/SmtB family transcription factor [Gemmatimonadaceae bacterium]